MYFEICEGSDICSDSKKCTQQFNRTGKEKCVKKPQFKKYSCDLKCKGCNHLKECDLILPQKQGLTNIEYRISDILKELQIIEEDYQYLTKKPQVKLYNTTLNQLIHDKEELTEELRTLRLKEKQIRKHLRKRVLKNLEVN